MAIASPLWQQQKKTPYPSPPRWKTHPYPPSFKTHADTQTHIMLWHSLAEHCRGHLVYMQMLSVYMWWVDCVWDLCCCCYYPEPMPEFLPVFRSGQKMLGPIQHGRQWHERPHATLKHRRSFRDENKSLQATARIKRTQSALSGGISTWHSFSRNGPFQCRISQLFVCLDLFFFGV